MNRKFSNFQRGKALNAVFPAFGWRPRKRKFANADQQPAAKKHKGLAANESRLPPDKEKELDEYLLTLLAKKRPRECKPDELAVSAKRQRCTDSRPLLLPGQKTPTEHTGSSVTEPLEKKRKNKRKAVPTKAPSPVTKKQKLQCSSQVKHGEGQTSGIQDRHCHEDIYKKESLKNAQQSNYSEEETKALQYLRKKGVPLLDEEELQRMASAGRKYVGSGTFGSCCKVRDPCTGEELVIKTFAEDGLKTLMVEAALLKKLQGAGVQRLVGACVKTRSLVSHFAGTIARKYLKSTTSVPDALSVFLQVAETLRRMHSQGFVHNDIKDDNVCVREGSTGHVVTVIDLGMARPVGFWKLYTKKHYPSNYPWVAPEHFLHTHPCSEASDAYMLGYMIRRARSVHGELFHSPSLAPVMAWAKKAVNAEPSSRPAIPELIKIIETINTRLRTASQRLLDES